MRTWRGHELSRISFSCQVKVSIGRGEDGLGILRSYNLCVKDLPTCGIHLDYIRRTQCGTTEIDIALSGQYRKKVRQIDAVWTILIPTELDRPSPWGSRSSRP